MSLTDLHVRVQHHPAREGLLWRLTGPLASLSLDVVADPEPEAAPDPWRTYRECLERPWPGTHLLIVQDDVLPCEGFAELATAAVAGKPDVPLALFVQNFPHMRLPMLRAHGVGERYAILPTHEFFPLVCSVWPRALAERIVPWWEADSYRSTSDDAVVGRFLRRNKIDGWCSVPCLAEHDQTVRSIVRKRQPVKHSGRVAVQL